MPDVLLFRGAANTKDVLLPSQGSSFGGSGGSFRIMLNQPFGKTLIHSNSNNFTIIIAGNSSVSNIAMQNETVISANIRRIWWGAATGGSFTVQRGANTVLILTPTSGVHDDYHEKGDTMSLDNTGTVVVTCNDVSSYFMIELDKNSTGQSGQY